MNPKQSQASQSFGQNLCLVAAAGSGKTSVLVERFFYAVTHLKADPRRVLAITFTERAASEMKKRLVKRAHGLGLERVREFESAPISTIHAFCAQILRTFPIEAEVSPGFDILSQGESELLIRQTLENLFEAQSQNRAWIDFLAEYGEKSVTAALKKFYDYERAMGELEVPSPHFFFEIYTTFKREYETLKKKRAVCDFEDLTYRTHKLLSGEKASQKAVREILQNRYQHVLVDEYQDTAPLQASIISKITNGKNLFVVGDPRQSIYRFRFADPKIFDEARRFSGQMELDENYRSLPSVLNFVNTVFSRLFSSAATPLKAARPAMGQDPAIELLCLTKDKAAGSYLLDDLRAIEAATIAERIRTLVHVEKKFKFGDIALLFRSRSSFKIFEAALGRAGVPFYSVSGTGFFDRPEVYDVLNFLKILGRPWDDLALAGFLRSPFVALSDDGLFLLAREAKKNHSRTPLWEALESDASLALTGEADQHKIKEFKAWFEPIRQKKDGARAADLLQQALNRTAYEAKTLALPNGRQKMANLRKMLELAQEFMGGASTAGDLLQQLEALMKNDANTAQANIQPENADGVALMTVHAAKGLEFPVVMVVDMGAGELKNRFGVFEWEKKLGFAAKGEEVYDAIVSQTKVEDDAESRRLLYVAMTRAKEKLLLSGAAGEPSAWMTLLAKEILPNASSLISVLQPVSLVGNVLSEALEESDHPSSGVAENLLREIPRRIQLPVKSYDQVRAFSVSDLLAASERVKTDILEEKDVLPLEPGEGVLPRNEFGTLFHKAMELAVLRGFSKIPRGWASSFTSGLVEQDKTEFEQAAQTFFKTPLAQEIRRSKNKYPELPFLFKTRRGLLKGQIDLVFQNKRKEWVIVDYKTNAITEKELERTVASYSLQLALYALVFAKLKGELPKAGLLYFTRLGRAVETPYTPADLKRWEAVLDENLDF